MREFDSSGPGQNAMVGSCDYINESMDSTKGEECPDQHSET